MSASTKKTPAAEAPKGVVAPTGGNRSGFLSDVIVELGFASRETVEQAVREARSPGTTVARVLVEVGAIDEEQLARATAERYGIDYVDLSGFDVDPTAANLIKPAAARRYQAVPVAHLDESLLVAMADPADALGVNDIAAMTKLDVRPAVASGPALGELLAALPLDEEGWAGGEAAAEAAAPEAEHEAAPPEGEAEAAEREPQGEALAPEDGAAAEREAEGEAAPAGGPAPARDGGAFAARAEDLLAQVTGLKHERDDLRSELRRVSADAEVRISELEALRAKLTGAETELVRVRAQADAHASELEAMRSRAESAEAETADALRRASEAEEIVDEARARAAELEHEVAGARGLAEELAAADARGEQARQALAEMREEAEREREQAAMTERELREKLGEEERRRGELEDRLAEVESAAFAAERSFEELRLAQQRMRSALRALADPDAPAPDAA
jgi:Type II secretion system (T2SS), protein E, N-terminal domain